jgi:hypothetical protein
VNKDQNNWRIVTAVDRLVKMTEEEMCENFSWIPHHAKETYKPASSALKLIDDSLIIEVNKILADNNISLIGTKYSLESLARDYAENKISKQDILNMKK